MGHWECEFKDKRALITGGAGFIGSNLAHRLVKLGASVVIVDSLIPQYGGNRFNLSGIEQSVRLNISDIRDVHGMSCLVAGQDYIFNLAGQVSHLESVRDPFTDLDINCRAQISILEKCRSLSHRPKIVFASTRQVYGCPQYLPVDEAHPLCPVDPNGINKIAGEQYHLLYAKLYGMHACCLRLTNTYGPRMRVCDARQTFIGWWFRQVIEGKEIQVFGDGAQVRDLNYVDDVVDALLIAVTNAEMTGGIFNLGSEPVSLLALANLLVELNDGGSVRVVPFPEERKKIDIGGYYGDFRKIAAIAGWSPRTSLRDGLTRTIDFYREFGQRYFTSEPVRAGV
jgi:UDP-glucose 4-epimerase